MFPEAKPRGTLRSRGNKTHFFPRGQLLSVELLYLPRKSLSFDQWHVTRSPPIRKRISVGR